VLEAFASRFQGTYYGDVEELKKLEVATATLSARPAPLRVLAAASRTNPLANEAKAPRASVQPPFGTEGVTFSVGLWRLKRVSQNDFHIWSSKGVKIIELRANSNGWWHLRDRSGTSVVWAAGNRDNQGLFTEPRATEKDTATAISSATYQHNESSERSTLVPVAEGRIVVTLFLTRGR
jgi:hypothetical protein